MACAGGSDLSQVTGRDRNFFESRRWRKLGDTTWDSKAHKPCNMTAVAAGLHSTCCADGDLCLTNGLCIPQRDIDSRNWYWRDGCTGKTWKDPACPKHCADIELLRKTGLVMNGLEPKSLWCCAIVGNGGIAHWPQQDAINTTCCSRDDLTFRAAEPEVYAIAGVAEFSTSSRLAVQTASELSTVSQSSTATATDSLSTSSASASAEQRSGSTGLGTSAIVGIAVGVLVGLILLCVVDSTNDALKTDGYRELPASQEAGRKQYNPTIYQHEASSTQVQELPIVNRLSKLPQCWYSTRRCPPSPRTRCSAAVSA
ncbi:hypothetical protein C7974DRAFT_381279 [Boeremia exigua]|uniref:uncharacterized protein n=1 Tax=Boeremia exigua TaxID=749465 RepID=UPI001E8E8163|nr:uncharacterized protein C7974DRAFT_381279 [Boeremia exigua]KAH6611794.1 hypothetical protein C7974DRAFT_381279 [Boeremia exigua]